MPSVLPLPPSELRDLLEALGYMLVASTDNVWGFRHGADGLLPITVPYNVDLVPVAVANQIARHIGMGAYVDAVARYLKTR